MSLMETTENPKEYLGREKPCISYIPMKLILRLAEVHRLGAEKYGQKNWRVQPVRMSTYYNAMFRHMVEWFESGEDLDAESKEHHLLHVVACALIILDGIDHSSMTDDRSLTEVKTGKLSGAQSQIEANGRMEVKAEAEVIAAIQAALRSAAPADIAQVDPGVTARQEFMQSVAADDQT